ncbi:2-C-methyl-D-erythritol 4-phosphate cytidylyltransferase [Sulfuricystis thermophila]|uniref:2-C-methyl-D-erythritol 4-phosphate cytidylyltransferase n=1 Tax=Sulfuricystis thermophila TaxID=2496847 RepID=UPI001036178E|nr:2-C-methyl-D-erythritol 4-phosphate cytidylyltransferase [Sulfuricystis thermophila]
MKYHALIPAAGGGTRMGGGTPKQYLPLTGRPLIWHTLKTLTGVAAIDHVHVVLAPEDEFWGGYDWSDFKGRLTVWHCGGATRAESVIHGLRALQSLVAGDDWVLVHDAARCCLTVEHVGKLLAEVGDDPVGGLLAVPVADTLKRAQTDGRVAGTVAREGLWQAQTPQMFRYRMLLEALERMPEVTDEAGAIEAMGLHPKLVAADMTNLKVTWPLDLQLAEWILANRRQ